MTKEIAKTNGIVTDDLRQLGGDVQYDIARLFAGKLWAYTAVVSTGGSGLGVAVANEAGYTPVPTFHYLVKNHSYAEAEAKRLNRLRDLSEDTVMEIVMSSMFPGSQVDDDKIAAAAKGGDA